MIFSLIKELEPNSLRWIGTHYSGLSPQKLPVAAKSVEDLTLSTGFDAYKLTYFRPSDGIIIYDGETTAYAYVSPYYRGYRTFLKKLVGSLPANYDVDHALAANLAKKLSCRYILLCAVPKGVNRRHGHYEKIEPHLERNKFSGVWYADNRIYNKILSRNPKARQNEKELEAGYSEKSKPSYGLALNQAGLWGSAFGLHLIDYLSLKRCLKKL